MIARRARKLDKDANLSLHADFSTGHKQEREAANDYLSKQLRVCLFFLAALQFAQTFFGLERKSRARMHLGVVVGRLYSFQLPPTFIQKQK